MFHNENFTLGKLFNKLNNSYCRTIVMEFMNSDKSNLILKTSEKFEGKFLAVL